MNRRPQNHDRRRGSILITTMWVVVALTGLSLALAETMRVEAIATANRLSEAQADAAERGAEQFLLSMVDAEVATPGSTAGESMEARQIGDSYFWVLTPSYDNEQLPVYGLTDEAGKLDLNTATLSMLQMLPNMPQDVAASIFNWRGAGVAGSGLGATDDYYLALPDPYRCKHTSFETTDELMLVKDVTPDLLFAADRNRNGVLDLQEQQTGGMTASFNGANGSNLGIFPFVTPWGVRATGTSPPNSPTPVDVNTIITKIPVDPRTHKPIAVNDPVGNLLTKKLGSTRGNQALVQARASRVKGAFQNGFDFAKRSGLSSSEFAKLYFNVTANVAGKAPSKVGKVNVNTAPRQVLDCLPGLQDADAQAIVAHRQTNASSNLTNIAWLLDVVTDPAKLALMGGWVTGRSTCYSGDIVAVSGDGRAFKRVRIVLDGKKGPTKIIYRRDLTGSGWPLPVDIRTALRAGHASDIIVQTSNTGIMPS